MLGLDVSKATLDYCLLDPTTRKVIASGQVPNTCAGIADLLARIPDEHPWVAEPTGVYSQAVVIGAQQAGRTVLQAEPRQAYAFLRALQPRAKTDRLDSLGLAHYALAVPMRPFPVKTERVVQLEQLLAARTGISASLGRLTQQQRVLPHAAAPLGAAIAALRDQLDVLDAQIEAATQQPDLTVARALDAIPGVGAVTAAAVAACLSTRTFVHPDACVAYIGLDVRVRDSGQRSGVRSLSKRGNAELRRLLYLCAQANLRSKDPDNPFKQQYAREVAKGLSSTAALNAVARKLARTCWSIATHGTTYDPSRVHHQPVPSIVAPVALDNEP
jgi:transposase